MNFQELNELELGNIGEWPVAIKAILVIILCGAVGATWYFQDIELQYKELDRHQATEQDLRSEFERKQAKAANLQAFKKQLAEMQESFGALLRQLPDKTEVADLLVDVSQTGLAAGLEFELFQPGAIVTREFYAELPIKMKVLGTYHEFGEFISGLAALPRIVTIHDITIKPQGGGRGRAADGGRLIMEATAKTYHYLEESG